MEYNSFGTCMNQGQRTEIKQSINGVKRMLFSEY